MTVAVELCLEVKRDKLGQGVHGKQAGGASDVEMGQEPTAPGGMGPRDAEPGRLGLTWSQLRGRGGGRAAGTPGGRAPLILLILVWFWSTCSQIRGQAVLRVRSTLHEAGRSQQRSTRLEDRSNQKADTPRGPRAAPRAAGRERVAKDRQGQRSQPTPPRTVWGCS